MEEKKEKKSLIEEGFVRKPDEPKTRNWLRTCKVCGREFYSVRKDCQFCSSYCRGRYWKEKMSRGIEQGEKTPTNAKNGSKKTIIGHYTASSSKWTSDRGGVLELRTWIKKNLGISLSYTPSYKKTVEALEEVSTDKVKYQLTRKIGRVAWTTYTLYKIIQ